MNTSSLNKVCCLNLDKKLILDLVILFTYIFSIISTILIALNINDYEYRMLWLLPLSYLVFFSFFFYKVIKKNNHIFLYTFWAISFLRYVILPLFIVLGVYYSGRSSNPPATGSIESAIFLMSYELLISYLFIYFLYIFKERIYLSKDIFISSNKKKDIQFSKTNFIYVIFFVIVIVLIIISPNSIRNVNFLVPNESFERSFSAEGFLYAISVYGILIAKNLVFLMIMVFLRKKNNNKRNFLWIALALLFVIINTSIYYGASRSDIIINGIVSIMTFFICFPKLKKLPLLIFFIFFISIIVSGVSSVRQIDYSKYVDFHHYADLLSIYLGGPYNVAMALETPIYFPEVSSFTVFFYDMFRPIIGIGYFLKNLPYHYSVYYFNYRIFSGSYNSQILPMIGQGYIFFGYIFSPIFSIFFIWIAYKLSKNIEKSNNLELTYFFSLVCVRLGFMMGQSGINQLNSLSLNLVLFILLYWTNKYFRIKWKE